MAPTVDNDILRACESILKYAITTQTPTPSPYTGPNDNNNNNGRKEMGHAYDIWLETVLRDARDASGALDRVTLMSTESSKANQQLVAMCGIITRRLEATMDYKSPYSPTSNTHGMVWSDDAWWKTAARRVHRSIAMQLLAIHMTRLHFLILVTHVDGFTGWPMVLDQAAPAPLVVGRGGGGPPPTFRSRLSALMSQIALAINSSLHTPYDTLDGVMGPNGPIGHAEAPFFSNLTHMQSTSDSIDVKRIDAQRATINLVRRSNYVAQFMGEFMRTAANLDQNQTIFGAYPVAGAGPAAANLAIAPPLANIARLVAYGNAFIDAPQTPFWDADMAQYSISVLGAHEFITHPDNHPTGIWMYLAGMAHDVIAAIEDHIRQETNAAGPGGVIVECYPFQSAELPRYKRRVEQLVADASANVMRFTAHDAATVAAEFLEPAVAQDQILRRFDDCITLPTSMFYAARFNEFSFIPKYADDRELLHRRLEHRREVTGLAFVVPAAVPGQYVYRRNQVQPRMQAVHLWQRRMQTRVSTQRLWALAHCEAPLMSDVYRLLEGLVLANKRIFADHAYPISEVTHLANRFGDQASLIAPLMEGLLAHAHGGAAIGFANAIDPPRIDAIQTLVRDVLNNQEAMPDPGPAAPGVTTQPMPADTRQWVQRVHDAFIVAMAPRPGAGLLMHVQDNIPWTPIHMNATPLRSVIVANAGGAAQITDAMAALAITPSQQPQPDRFASDNVVITDNIDPNLYPMLLVSESLRPNPLRIGLFAGYHLYNSTTLSYIPAILQALVLTYPGPAPELLGSAGSAVFNVNLNPAGVNGHEITRATAPVQLPGEGYHERLGDANFEAVDRLLREFLRNNAQVNLRAVPAQMCIGNLKTRCAVMHNEYSARKAPFTHPGAWLDVAPAVPGVGVIIPPGAPVAGVGAAILPQPLHAGEDPEPWEQIEADDRIDGMLINLPVIGGAAPAAPGAAAPGAALNYALAAHFRI